MGDLISIVALLGFAAFILREYRAQHVEQRADRRSISDFTEWREELRS